MGTCKWRRDARVAAENKRLEAVYTKYETYVAPTRNEIRATVTFNCRKQENHFDDDFVTSLRILARDCSYGKLEDRMIRDAIVLRSLHPKVRERCKDKGIS